VEVTDKLIIHKAKYHQYNEKAKLPFKTAYCGDEYHYEVMNQVWSKVNCPECLTFNVKKQTDIGHQHKIVTFTYTNYKNITATRIVRPKLMYWGFTDYHKEVQWLLVAYDIDRKADRTFAMVSISNWKQVVKNQMPFYEKKADPDDYVCPICKKLSIKSKGRCWFSDCALKQPITVPTTRKYVRKDNNKSIKPKE